MKNLSLIAAIGYNNELGLDNRLLWHIPEDLAFYKEMTMGKNIIMGRNTFQSAFMAGDMKMKGDFKVLRGLDQVLIFGSRTMD